MAIKESALSLITSIAQGDWIRAVTSAGASRRVTVANLAKAIVESYTGSTLAGSSQSVKAAIDSLNSKTSISEQMLTFTDSAGKSANIYFRYDETILSVLVSAVNAIIVPTTWTVLGSLSNFTCSSDRYVPLVCPSGGIVILRIYADGGVRIIGNQSTAIWLQSSGTVIYK